MTKTPQEAETARDFSGFDGSPETGRNRSIAVPPPPPSSSGTPKRRSSDQPTTTTTAEPTPPASTSKPTPKRPPAARRTDGAAKNDAKTDGPIKRTFTVPLDLLDAVRAVADDEQIWVAAVLRAGLRQHAAQLGPPPSGIRTRSRKPTNYVAFSAFLDSSDDALLMDAAGHGRNRSWVIREVLARQIGFDLTEYR